MRRVVVVADGGLHPETIQGALGAAGFEAVLAADGEQARTVVEGGAAGVVVGVGAAGWPGSSGAPLLAMPVALRRSCVLVAVGQELVTADAGKAFLMSVDVVVSTSDAGRLGEVYAAALAYKRSLVNVLDPVAAARLGA